MTNVFLEHIEVWGLGVAILALLRPEIVSVWRRFFNKIHFYPTGLLEIGFFDYGPTIGIAGTVRSTGGNQFISLMRLRLTRERDNATYNYSWGVFREFDLGTNNNIKVEIASAFSLFSTQGKALNIQFHDTATRDRYRQVILSLRTGFEKFLIDNGTDLTALNQTEILNVQNAFKGIEVNNGLVLNAYSTLGREFYWEAGNYKLELVIETDRPHKQFNFSYCFSLNEEEVNEIDVNRIGLTQAAMFSEFSPKFINVSYASTLT